MDEFTPEKVIRLFKKKKTILAFLLTMLIYNWIRHTGYIPSKCCVVLIFSIGYLFLNLTWFYWSRLLSWLWKPRLSSGKK